MYKLSLAQLLEMKSCQSEWQINDCYCTWAKIVVAITGEDFVASSGLCLLGYGEMNPKAMRLLNEFLNALGTEQFYKVTRLNDQGKHKEALMCAVNSLCAVGIAELS